MPLLTALTISIGVLAAIATWLVFSPFAFAAFNLQIGAVFIAWAAFYHSGGKTAALQSNIPAHLFGAFIGWLALYGVTLLGGALGVPIAAAILVGLGAAVIVYAANLPALASIPSSVYGFGSIASYALLANKLGTLTALSIVDNPLLNIWISMIVGALFGWVSEKLGGVMAKS